jgi:hypothetical protein
MNLYDVDLWTAGKLNTVRDVRAKNAASAAAIAAGRHFGSVIPHTEATVFSAEPDAMLPLAAKFTLHTR